MIESKGWILLALAFAVLLVLLNLSTLEEKASVPLFGKKTEDKFDYKMHQMVTQQFDDNGKLTSTLSAESLIHFPGKQIINLSRPTLLFSVAEQFWTLEAETGSLSEVSEELLLGKLVTIKNIFEEKQIATKALPKPVNIEVDELKFDLQRQIASSPNQVKMTSANWLVKGEGLSIDVTKQTLKILHKVEATHENL